MRVRKNANDTLYHFHFQGQCVPKLSSAVPYLYCDRKTSHGSEFNLDLWYM